MLMNFMCGMIEGVKGNKKIFVSESRGDGTRRAGESGTGTHASEI